jgi:hypothetical protein
LANVLTFWQLPEEEEEFLDFLLSTGVVVAYPNHWVMTSEETEPQPLRRCLAQSNPKQCLLGLDSDAAHVVVGAKSQENEHFLSVDVLASCLIGYSRPQFRGECKLGQSNLSASLQYPSAEEKPDWFQSWVKNVFAWIKKRASKKYKHQGYSYPATHLAVQRAEEGRVELVL